MASLLERVGNKIVYKSKTALFNTPFYNSVFPLKKGAVIIMYHGIDSVGSTQFNTRHAAKSHFEMHIKFLKKHTNVISVTDFFDKKFNPDKLNVAITFDDGYLNNFENALPILEAYQCPATFYITGINNVEDKILWADLVNIASKLQNKNITVEGEEFENRNGIYFSKDRDLNLYQVIKYHNASYNYKLAVYKAFDDVYRKFTAEPKYDEYWRLMSDAQIAETSRSKYVEIGSHSYYHNNLGTIPLADAKAELAMSVSYLTGLTGKPINSIAYPDGSYSKDVIDEAEKVGLACQLAADGYLYDDDKFDSRISDRNGIYSCDDFANQLLVTLK